MSLVRFDEVSLEFGDTPLLVFIQIMVTFNGKVIYVSAHLNKTY